MRTALRNLAICAVALAAMAGCRSSERLMLVMSTGEVLTGGATTAVNGQYSVRNDRVSCYGTYEGRTVAGLGLTIGRKSAVTVNCSDGRQGSSDDLLYEAGQAQIRFKDGKTGRMTLGSG